MASHLFQHLFSFDEGGDVNERLRRADAAMQRHSGRPEDVVNVPPGSTPSAPPSPSEALEAQYGDRIPYSHLIPRDAVDLRFDESGATPVNAKGETIPWTRRPQGLLPVTREHDGSLRFAMPSLAEIMGNVAGPVPAGALASGLNVPKASQAARIAPRVNPETGLYSAALHAAENMGRSKGRAIDFYNELKNMPGVKPAELEWTGTQKFLTENPERPLTRDDLVKHLTDNQVNVADHATPTANMIREGVKLRRERLDASDRFFDASQRLNEFPVDQIIPRDRMQEADELLNQVTAADQAHRDHSRMLSGMPQPKFEEYTVPRDPNVEHSSYGEHLLKWDRPGEIPVYTADTHWGSVPNPLLHMRFNDRIGPNGERLLHMEELQSDWAQQGRSNGFREEHPVVGGPQGPTVTNLPPLPHPELQAAYSSDEIVPELRRIIRAVPDRGWREAYFRDLNSGETSPSDIFYALQYETSLADNRLLENLDERQRALLLHYTVDPGENIIPQSHLDHFANLDADPTNVENWKTPRGPFVQNTDAWTELAMKRALYRAAKDGYDGLVWSPGEIHARRYNLGNHFSELSWDPNTGYLSARTHDGMGRAYNIPKEQLEAHVGPEIAKALVENPGATLSGDSLWVGGEGHRSFYDKMVPKNWQKVLKRHDPEAKLEDFPVNHLISGGANDRTTGRPVHADAPGVQYTENGLAYITTPMQGFRMTPKMRESILRGQPLFVRAPLPPLDSLTSADQNQQKYAEGGPVSDEEALAATMPTSPTFAGPMGNMAERIQRSDTPAKVNFRSPLQILQEKAEKAKHMPDLVNDVYNGKVDLHSTEGIDEAVGMAGAMADLGMGASTAVPSDATAGMFIGRKAADFSPEREAKHLRMRTAGMSPEETWRQTQNLIGSDLVPRQELTDYMSDLKGTFPYLPRRRDLPITDVFSHDQLYHNYPELKNLSVYIDPDNTTAHWDAGNKRISINPNYTNKVGRGVMLHELQHAVDTIEGVQNGVAPSTALQMFVKEAPLDIRDKLRDVDPRSVAYESYLRHLGENFARATDERKDLSSVERSLTHPAESLIEPLGLSLIPNKTSREAWDDMAKHLLWRQQYGTRMTNTSSGLSKSTEDWLERDYPHLKTAKIAP